MIYGIRKKGTKGRFSFKIKYTASGLKKARKSFPQAQFVKLKKF